MSNIDEYNQSYISLMTLIDDNSEHIPEGLYLNLVNSLAKLKKDDPNFKSGGFEHSLIQTYEELIEPDLRHRDWLREIDRPAQRPAPQRITPKQYSSIFGLDNDDHYITNPETGRRVLRTRPLGISIIEKELIQRYNIPRIDS